MKKLFTLMMACTLPVLANVHYSQATNPPTCYNITDAGEISGEEYGCGSFDPAVISSVSPASGGSGTIEYIWLSNSVPSVSGSS
ncbi:MAG: hypothetical protein HKN22_03195, partial [Bacteroidia bacterium]|nr:hypothetical protein [Bacteroidia bacterium]